MKRDGIDLADKSAQQGAGGDRASFDYVLEPPI